MIDNDLETRAWLIWLRAPGVGPATLRAVLARSGSAARALDQGPEGWRAWGLPAATRAWLARPNIARIDADLRWLSQPRHHLVRFDGEDYPPQLRRAPDPPVALFVRGEPWLLWRAQIAVVGARHASVGGAANARDFASTLARSGLTITSGLAQGIDGAAHQAALDAGEPTIAICGTGLEHVYPRRHEALAERIAEHGALVSELPLDAPPRADHFPRRNRIIAAAALGVLVIEAGMESGSLITARLAAECGREVFALPGSIHHPLARGCHRLLRDGATLVETADEVRAALSSLLGQQGEHLREALGVLRDGDPIAPLSDVSGLAMDDPDTRHLLAALGTDPLNPDEIASRAGLTSAEVSSMLTALELEGVVVAGQDGRFARIAVGAPSVTGPRTSEVDC